MGNRPKMATEKKTLKKIIDLTQKASCRHEKTYCSANIVHTPPPGHTQNKQMKKRISKLHFSALIADLSSFSFFWDLRSLMAGEKS